MALVDITNIYGMEDAIKVDDKVYATQFTNGETLEFPEMETARHVETTGVCTVCERWPEGTIRLQRPMPKLERLELDMYVPISDLEFLLRTSPNLEHTSFGLLVEPGLTRIPKHPAADGRIRLLLKGEGSFHIDLTAFNESIYVAVVSDQKNTVCIKANTVSGIDGLYGVLEAKLLNERRMLGMHVIGRGAYPTHEAFEKIHGRSVWAELGIDAPTW